MSENPVGYSDRVPAVDQAARILFYLAEEPRGSATLTEICGAVGIYKSKGRALLNTLREARLVTRDDSLKTFSLGPGLLVLSRALLDRTDLPVAAAPFLEELAVTPGTCAFLAAIRGAEVYVVARREAPGGLSVTIRVGYHYPLTWGSIGKAVVAFLPEDERAALLQAPPHYFYGDPSNDRADDLTRLNADLEQVRRLGYGVDLGAVQPGLHAVSAPLLGGRHQDRPVGIVTLCGTFPAESIAYHGERVRSTASQMSLHLGPFLEGRS